MGVVVGVGGSGCGWEWWCMGWLWMGVVMGGSGVVVDGFGYGWEWLCMGVVVDRGGNGCG